jgi:hypothetical protein
VFGPTILLWVGVAIAASPGLAYAVAYAIAFHAPTAKLLIDAAVPVPYFVGVTLARIGGTGAYREPDGVFTHDPNRTAVGFGAPYPQAKKQR